MVLLANYTFRKDTTSTSPSSHLAGPSAPIDLPPSSSPTLAVFLHPISFSDLELVSLGYAISIINRLLQLSETSLYLLLRGQPRISRRPGAIKRGHAQPLFISWLINTIDCKLFAHWSRSTRSVSVACTLCNLFIGLWTRHYLDIWP